MSGSDLAIIGMAGRFPGASTLERFWENIRGGVDCVSDLTDEELRAAGVSEASLRNPKYVRRASVLDDIETFDAEFFGFSPKEVELIDPQHRLFLECAWEALENGGVDPGRYPGAIGVFAGTSYSTYLLRKFLREAGSMPVIEHLQLQVANDKDYLASRVSYKLNLRGPSLCVQTSCSTSLVAVHLACQSVLDGESDMALAGGVCLRVPQRVGYIHQEGGILSPDGRCRSFDARGAGTIQGSGLGVIVIKRLADALKDGDPIRAVIKGSAINNDGASKVGYMAPSHEGQARVISEALSLADVEPATVGYLECHGTATRVGDPLELQALAEVFSGVPRGSCAVGSVKANLGHLESAAGIAGLIKAVLVLEHGELPPLAHFQEPNPGCDFPSTPFFVPPRAQPFPKGAHPRRAGVSSFGIGGTNAHVVLEEAPAPAARSAVAARPWSLFTLSARSEPALRAQARSHAAFLRSEAGRREALADLCFTSGVRRAHHTFRLAAVCRSHDELAEALDAYAEGTPHGHVVAGRAPQAEQRPQLTFLFTGQGSQYAGMGRGLYESHPTFRQAIDRCVRALEGVLPLPLTEVLFGEGAPLDQTQYTQPALFALEYALSEVWREWGVVPDAVLGHSVGEFPAACTAGVFELEEGIRLVAERARLMQQLPAGGVMVAVQEGEAEVQPLLAAHPAVSLAAFNGPRSVVLSGPAADVDAVVRALESRGIKSRALTVSHAFHSALMEPALPAFGRAAASVSYRPPKVAWVTNLTGEQASSISAQYWEQQLREPVRFAQGVQTLAAAGRRLFLEVGPQPVLSGLAASILPSEALCLASLRSGRDAWQTLMQSAGQLYVQGVALDWRALHGSAHRCVAAPGYAWQRERYWVDDPLPGRSGPEAPVGRSDEAPDITYALSWRSAPAPVAGSSGVAGWLVLCDAGGVGASLVQAIEARGERCLSLTVDEVTRELDAAAPFEGHVAQARSWAGTLGVVHACSLDAAATGLEALRAAEVRSTGSALRLVQALQAAGVTPLTRLWLVTREGQAVEGGAVNVSQAPLWGFARSVQQELPELSCRAVDLGAGDCTSLAGQLLAELSADGEPQTAWRRERRYVARLERVRAAVGHGPSLRSDGTYLVTGGLGALGLQVAEWMVERGARHLALFARRSVSPAHSEVLERLRSKGANVHVASVDIVDREALSHALAHVAKSMPPLRGVVHAAGVLDEAMLPQLTPERLRNVMAPKVDGAWSLHELTAGQPLELFVLFSSVGAVFGAPGQANYGAANAFLGALAHHRHQLGLPATAVDFGPWAGAGMSSKLDAARWAAHRLRPMSPEAALGALGAALGSGRPQVAVAEVDWDGVFSDARRPPALFAELAAGRAGAAGRSPAAVRTVERLKAAAPHEVDELLVAHVRGELGEVLGHPPSRPPEPWRGFYELGMDSLSAVHFRRRMEAAFDVPLATSAVFDHPTVERFSRYLKERLFPDAPAPVSTSAPVAPQPRTDAVAAEVDGLSADEVSSALLELTRSVLSEEELGE
ncbi:type I polyketide synthase [Pyxidicoccus xibeiensis]|uniref:type I polyketide synthase n=1 Tax=Pyxidicoccus xibeiensis TaxID=2906759 RepID=UPI0020A6F885|nr:type I polyketide synthase [Pyxidicoccus xibeiensis]MCP3137624.1 type I polyketide synthase [Pyxidicoccus xibeiensis]